MLIIKNIGAVILAIIIGSAVNMGLVTLGAILIPAPEGIDPNNLESLKQGIHLFEFKHYIFPFLAHAVGTLVASFTATMLVTNKQQAFAFGLGCIFLLGGFAAAYMIPAHFGFVMVDLLFAYLPMAWIGYKLSSRFKSK
ncbi:MAG: hypothetical protein HWE27_14310 [Gammaproteobacteria bacterium]|nr:hypothetical protein [Gammaproteobacteria bacterium]